jgi:transposase
MLSVGLDVHFRKSSLCVLDDHGKVLREAQVIGTWEKVVDWLGRLPEPFKVCYEASLGYGHLYERIGSLPLAKQVQVAHPGQVRLIYKARQKNDRVDARKLAKLLYLEEVPRVHVPGEEVRSWRALIEWRQKLIGRRVMVKNQIRALLKSVGIVPLAGHKLWSQEGQAWLGLQVFSGRMETVRRDMLVEELREHQGRIKRVEKELEAIAGQDPRVALLRTIPGVGIRTAEAFVAYVDDPQRFARVGQVGSYFGLVPCQDASGDRNRLGHITKQGPATVRKLLVEATWQGVLRDKQVRGHLEKIQRGDAGRRRIALVATARWLCEVMLAMLHSGEPWRPERPAAVVREPEPRAAAVRD